MQGVILAPLFPHCSYDCPQANATLSFLLTVLLPAFSPNVMVIIEPSALSYKFFNLVQLQYKASWDCIDSVI